MPVLFGSSAPRPRYTVVGETLRYVIPSHMQCSIACGGRCCKYEDPVRWSDDSQAIRGLYSSWITDDLLAMARPSTEVIEKYNIIEQFQRCGLRSIINLQHPGEHASCGNDLEPDSGFTYRPEAFMEAGIYFYNFGWKDYGVASLTTILDMVKVMSFAVQEGKMAVHCHAGLGRTGVLLACYLLFTTKMTADQAILFVRGKRPNSIQTRGQLSCVREFARFLVPLRSVFSCAEPQSGAVTLAQYLTRQHHLLHGYEARRMKHMPRLVMVVCRLLLDIAANRQVLQEDILDVPDQPPEEKPAPRQLTRKLSREGMGRGEGTSLPRLPGPATVPLRPAEPQLFYVRRSLSYSESDLSRLGSVLHLSGAPSTPCRQCMSQGSLTEDGRGWGEESVYSSVSSVWEHAQPVLSDRSPLYHRRKLLRDMQRSQSLGCSGSGGRDEPVVTASSWRLRQERGRGKAGAGVMPRCGEGDQGKEEEEEQTSKVPFITIQSELTPEARRLLVAQALAVDLQKDGEEEHKQRVCSWQRELNSGEGGWEGVCSERDPFVLSGLMWSWLEQLKEPIFSRGDVRALGDHAPHKALQTLDKGRLQTLTCILDCAAHVMTTADEVEAAFLDRTIKALTKMSAESEEGKTVYQTMRAILKAALQDMRQKLLQEPDTPNVGIPIP
ncbi:protein tyrosine phosphatase domain-containing protein 1 [Megalops cyprinoides]|uniref:protein tyrosine phosphatase domain-containing protein 1 n=1 Tax=Megalops cyprinoides TaxID=118141 RepID=UPI001864A26C|nr:protein tyrosine phosphatase domain-containing protein 1 [Megalops cyprinoides]